MQMSRGFVCGGGYRSLTERRTARTPDQPPTDASWVRGFTPDP